jgi:hypothetical protein
MLIISLTSRGLFTKNLSWQAKQSIPHITVTFYGDCVKMYEDFVPNFGDKITGCCIPMHRLKLSLSLGISFYQKQLLSSLTHPTFVFPIEDKTEMLPC